MWNNRPSFEICRVLFSSLCQNHLTTKRSMDVLLPTVAGIHLAIAYICVCKRESMADRFNLISMKNYSCKTPISEHIFRSLLALMRTNDRITLLDVHVDNSCLEFPVYRWSLYLFVLFVAYHSATQIGPNWLKLEKFANFWIDCGGSLST